MKLDELVKGCPEVYQLHPNYALSRLHEFSFDDTGEKPPFGAFIIWEPPRKGFQYTIGVDPSWGVGADRSVIHVLRNGTLHSLDTQVAEYVVDNVNMHDLSALCWQIGNIYKDPIEDMEALMSVECNISDDVVHDLRTKFNYTNLFVWKYYDNRTRMMSNKLGWWTNARTRPKLINKAIQYVQRGWWDIKSPWLIYEMKHIRKEDAQAQVKASHGFHDDIFMAGAIALWSAHDLEFSEFGPGEEMAAKRDHNYAQRVEMQSYALPPLNERKDYINTDCSYEDMMSDSDWGMF